MLRLIYLLFFITTFSFAISVRSCTPTETASIGCNVTNPYVSGSIVPTAPQILCYVDIEEYQNGSSKNIPHCVKEFHKTWAIDTTGFASDNCAYNDNNCKNDPAKIYWANDHYHVYAPNSGGSQQLIAVLDDHSAKLRQRVVNKRVNGDMAAIGATVMIQKDGGYSFDPSPTNNKSSVYSEKDFENNGGFSASSYTQCQSDFIYNPNKLSYCQNSASSTFDFSEKGTFIQNNLIGKNIVYARLYWGGSIFQNWKVSGGTNFIPSALNYIKGYSRIDFKAPGESVVTIDAKPEDIFWIGSFSEYRPKSMTLEAYKLSGDHQTSVKAGINYVYVASADVTEIVKKSFRESDASRTFAAGNIRATTTSPNLNFIDVSDGYFTKNGGTVYLQKVYGALLFSPVNANPRGGYWIVTNPAQYAAWSLVIIYDFDDETAAKNNIEPKMVNIFDGFEKLAPEFLKNNELSNPPSNPKVSTMETKLTNLHNPKNGDINATLMMFSFGARKEIVDEDIEIKTKNNKYESITSKYNEKGKQFNSTMTKFNKLINPGKVFNNQVDLDIFDVSKFIKNDQKDVEMRFKAATTVLNKNGTNIVSSERINLALVGFSSRVYRPEVCYDEYIYKKEPNQSNKPENKPDKNFKFTKIEPNKPTKVPKDTILTTIVRVKNESTLENAENFALKAIMDSSQDYIQDTTYLIASINNPSVMDNQKDMFKNYYYNKDNTKLQKINGNEITFFLGDGSNTNIGGLIKKSKGNHAYVAYDTMFNMQKNKNKPKAFKGHSYKSVVVNSSKNLGPYDTYIKKCGSDEYDITIENQDEPNDFIPSSKSDDGSAAFKNRLLTQIVSKPFDVYITNYGTDGSKRVPDSPVDVKVELVDSCSATSNLYEKNIKFNDQSEILLSNIKIDKAYSNVKFRISHPNPAKKTNPTAPENIVACENLDEFAIRPSHFSLWDTSTDAIYAGTNSLVGGAIHDNIALAAMSPNNTSLANGYINNLGANEINLTPKSSATCDPTILNEENKLSVNFNNINKAVAKILRQTSSGSVGFSYSDIGDTTLEVLDSSYTRKDQDTIHGDDCVKGSDENDPTKDPEGRVGCNIKLKGNSRYIFNPKDIQISNLKIVKDDEVTYLDNGDMQKAKLTFDVVAKLSNGSPAKLYNDGCYANLTSFNIKLDKVPLNFTDNDGNAGTLTKANEEILLFEIPSSNTKKSTDPSATKWTFYVGRSSFQNGEAHGEINFNFARKINRAKNPFTVSSDDFSFSDLSDGKTSSAPYTKPVTAQKTSAKFYYGRVYAPYYEGPASGFNAKIYYGAYCDGCDKNIYMKNGTKEWEIFPSTISWYTNPTHHAGVLQFGDFRFANNTTLKDNVSAVNNGEQLIFVSNQRPVVDIASMQANSWLLYNEFSENAQTNDFTLKFLVPNGDWAGKTLGKKSNTGDVGKVIGAEGNFKDLSDKTNRRISW